jgi:hypothetical protein
MGNHKMPIPTQDCELYIVYHYATTTRPLLDMWILALGGGCANVGFPMPTTMHLINIVPLNGSTGNLHSLTHQYFCNVW